MKGIVKKIVQKEKMLDMMTNKFVINVEEKVIGHAVQINIW